MAQVVSPRTTTPTEKTQRKRLLGLWASMALVERKKNWLPEKAMKLQRTSKDERR